MFGLPEAEKAEVSSAWLGETYQTYVLGEEQGSGLMMHRVSQAHQEG